MLNSIRITKLEEPYPYFNILDNLPIDEKNIDKIREFNNSITVKTQSLYLQHLHDIIKTNEITQINLIKTYFGKKSNFSMYTGQSLLATTPRKRIAFRGECAASDAQEQ